MIITLTLNPAIDHTVELDGPLRRDTVQRARRGRRQAGGKGVNVARTLQLADVDTLAVVPAGDDDPFLQLLDAEHLPHLAVPISGTVRSNLALTEPDGTTTKINEPGPLLNGQEFGRLLDAVVEAARGADWLVLAGSLPPGAPPSAYATIVAAVRRAPQPPRIALDTAGAPLREAIDGGVDLVKPNAHELAELLGGHDGDRLEADPRLAMDGALGALTAGARAVLLTLGAHGAIYRDAEHALLAASPTITAISTVGAGDAALAGFLLARQEAASPQAALAQAVAHGAAAASLPGSDLPRRADTHPRSVRIESWPTTTAAEGAPSS